MAKSGLKKATELAAEAESLASPELIAAAVKRAENARARAHTVKREKVTPQARQTHAVNNENVHDSNDTDRQLDARHNIERDSEQQTSWVPPSKLDAPPPRSGYANRWVRFRAESAEDAEHFEEMLDQGWRPIKRASVKKVHELTASTHGKYGQYYVKRNLILMEIPEKLALQARRYYAKQQSAMNEGVDRSMFKLQNSVMPLLQPRRSTRVSLSARRGRLDANVPGEEVPEPDDVQL
jgi:hypothetical protein